MFKKTGKCYKNVSLEFLKVNRILTKLKLDV